MVWFAEPLEMHDLTLSEKSYGVDNVRVVYHSQNIVIGGAGFLLCRKIFRQIGYGIALALKICSCKGSSRCRLRIDTCCMVNKISVKPALFYLVNAEISGELIQYGGDHFDVCQLFRPNIRKQPFQLRIRHTEPLIQITKRRCKLAVGTSKLADYELSRLWIGILDIYGILQFTLISNIHIKITENQCAN